MPLVNNNKAAAAATTTPTTITRTKQTKYRPAKTKIKPERNLGWKILTSPQFYKSLATLEI